MKKETIVICITTVVCAILIFAGAFAEGKDKFAFWRQWFLYAKNTLSNNNSKNYSCHNYAHNLLIGVETNSIFMTEGGDNQVFSLLYYSYVENKRPDIDFYDQKGNIFPRLYGDLLNTHYIELDLIRAIRDYQLYSTGRPVYLTWKRPNAEKLSLSYIQLLRNQLIAKMKSMGYRQAEIYVNRKFRVNTLEELKTTASILIKRSIFNMKFRNGQSIAKTHFSDLGPWYLKDYGIVYKVMPIRYALLDAAEFYGRLDLNKATQYVKNAEKVTLTAEETQKYISELIQEGLITFNKNIITFIKPQVDPFMEVAVKDYPNHYYQDTMDLPEARYWDLLSRQIYSVYLDYQLTDLSRKTKYLNSIDKSFLPASFNIEEQKNAYAQEKLKILELYLSFGYDNPSVHQIVAQHYIYLKNLSRATDILENVPNIAWDFLPVLGHITRLLFRMSLTIPIAEREEHKLRIERHLDFVDQRLYKIFRILRPGQNHEQTREYQELQFFRNRVSSLYQLPSQQPQSTNN